MGSKTFPGSLLLWLMTDEIWLKFLAQYILCFFFFPRSETTNFSCSIYQIEIPCTGLRLLSQMPNYYVPE